MSDGAFVTFTNSVDPDEVQHHAAFHLGFTVCKSAYLGVFRIQRLKVEMGVFSFHSNFKRTFCKASNEGPDLMSCPVASDLGLHYLRMLDKNGTRLI